MSMYNLINGFNLATVFFLPMLGKRPEEYPRFRDCYLSEDNQRIVIFTRVGGNNRNSGFNEEKLYEDPNFVETYDDEFDNTYGYYEFNPPEKWKTDFQHIINDELEQVSNEYIEFLKKFFPILNEKGLIDKLFKRCD